MSPKRFLGRRVLLTGASGGLGEAMAQGFSAEGAEVCLSGRKEDPLKRIQASLPGPSSLWIADLSDKAAVLQMARDVLAMGKVDILINNGGLTHDQLLLRMKEEAWDKVIQVNLTAAFQLSREVLPGMLKQKWGRILNIASIVAMTGNPGQANYVASKAGLLGLTKTLALEVASRGITVNAIAPGFMDTPMTQNLSPELVEKMSARIPCQKFGRPEDVAFGALFLADERASYITGETLHINGGMGMF